MWSGCENVVWTQENEKGRQKEKLKNGELPHTASDGIYQINTPCLARLFQFLILFSVIAIFFRGAKLQCNSDVWPQQQHSNLMRHCRRVDMKWQPSESFVWVAELSCGLQLLLILWDLKWEIDLLIDFIFGWCRWFWEYNNDFSILEGLIYIILL